MQISEALALAAQHHQAGRLPEAEQIYRQILQADPAHAEAWNRMGRLAFEQQNVVEAERCVRRTVELNSNMPEYYVNWAYTLEILGRLDEAIAAYRRAVELNPDQPDAQSRLGNLLAASGRDAEAASCFEQALRQRPDDNELLAKLVHLLKESGREEEAFARLHQAVERSPNSPAIQNNLGNIYLQEGRWEDAVACYRRVVELKPELAEAHANLGKTLVKQRKPAAALSPLRQAVACNPNLPQVYNDLGNALADQGRIEEALDSYRQALRLLPDYPLAHSNLLFTWHYRPGVTLAELYAAHEEFERCHAAALRAGWRAHTNVRDPEKRLRLGFVSPDLGQHPVGQFLIRTAESLDRRQCELVFYCDRSSRDPLATRFHAAAAAWHNVWALDDERLAEKIRADGVDILFDLSGHTAGNRLLVFARKPAPVQISWIGYEGTTGLRAIDYLLSDRHLIPPEAEPFCCERVLRLPEVYTCYDPPDPAPPIKPPPSLASGQVTFACFNNPAKLSRDVVDTFARILRRVESSRLILKYAGLDEPETSNRFLQLFTQYGIGAGCVEFRGRSPTNEYLATYEEVDVALDPFPFSGGITTCDILWMGVPVVTCPGPTVASRHGLSYLSAIGETETVARDWDQYVDLAVALASDPQRLAALRSRLRTQMSTSPLCNGPRLADHLLGVLREVWRAWASREASGELD